MKWPEANKAAPYTPRVRDLIVHQFVIRYISHCISSYHYHLNVSVTILEY